MIFAFARRHREHGGEFGEVPQADDASKFHTVLSHPEERRSDFDASNEIKKSGPEVVTLGGATQGIVHEDAVGIAHPEAQVQQDQKQPKPEVDYSQNYLRCSK